MRNIRDPQKYLSSFWDWTFLNDCFGDTKIRVTDIDGAVERKGYTLIFETKLPDQEVPQGQAILFDNWVNQGITVLVIWGERNQPIAAQQWGQVRVPADREWLRQYVRNWFAWADGHR